MLSAVHASPSCTPPDPLSAALLRRTAVKCSNDDEKLSELVIMHVPKCMRGCCDQSQVVAVSGRGEGRVGGAVHVTGKLEAQPQPQAQPLSLRSLH